MAKRKKKKKFSRGLTITVAVLLFVMGAVGGFVGYHHHTMPHESDVFVSGDLAITFLELGNVYTGDCTYIKAGENDILIDAGSRWDSIETISAFLDEQVTDGILEYVVVTHAHQDHYAGFATNESTDSLFDLYECEVIIDFAQIEKGREDTKMYQYYQRELADEIAAGAVHYTARDCIEQQKHVFDMGYGIEMEILDSQFYYERSSSENNHSVCLMFNEGNNHYLFTGDLEAEGEEYLVLRNELPKMALYKAGHHGSKTSSSEKLLEVIQPEVICVCCCAGSAEYSDTSASQFPTQAFVDRVAPYTDRVYVTTLCVKYEKDDKEFTSMNGNITVRAGTDGIDVKGSNNDTKLKDTDWFKQNRTCPKAWK